MAEESQIDGNGLENKTTYNDRSRAQFVLHTFDSSQTKSQAASATGYEANTFPVMSNGYTNGASMTNESGESSIDALAENSHTIGQRKRIPSPVNDLGVSNNHDIRNFQQDQNAQGVYQELNGMAPPFHYSQAVEITDTATNRPIEIIPMTQMRQRSLRKRTIEQLYPYRIELERYKQRFEQAGIQVRKKDASEKVTNSNPKSHTASPVSMGRNMTPDRHPGPKPRATGDSASDADDEVTRHSSSTPAFINRRKRIIHDEDSLEREEIPVLTASLKEPSEIPQAFREDDGPSSPLSDTFSSDEYQTSDSEPEKEKELEMLNTLKKRVKGVLPPSFITLEYAKFLNKRKEAKNSTASKTKDAGNESNTPQKGLAKRKIGKRTEVGPLGLSPIGNTGAQVGHQTSETADLFKELELSSDGDDASQNNIPSERAHAFAVSQDRNVLANSDSDISEDDAVDSMLQTKSRPLAVKKPRRKPSSNTKASKTKSTPTRRRTRQGNRSVVANTSQQLSIRDVYAFLPETRMSNKPPGFMKIATRTAAAKTRNRSDTPFRKYIHIEDDEGVSAAPRNTLKRWRKGELKKPKAHETITKPRRITSVNRSATDSTRITNVVSRLKDTALEKESGKETFQTSSALSTRLNSRESYLEKRQRQFQTVVLEAPTGRYAVRPGKAAMRNTFEGRLEGLRGPNNLHTREPVIDIFARVMDWAADSSQNLLASQNQDNKKMKRFDNPFQEPDKRTEKKKSKAVRREVRKQKRQEARRQMRLEAARSMAKSNFESARELRTKPPAVESFDCGLCLPPNDLTFSGKTFIGRGYLQAIIHDKNMGLNLENMSVVKIDDTEISLDQQSFVSSIGLSVSLLKKQFHNSSAHNDNTHTPTELFSALFSIAYYARKFPHLADMSNISCLISTLHQLVVDIKSLWTENLSMKNSKNFWNMSIRSYSYSLAILYYLRDVYEVPNNIPPIVSVVNEGFSFLLSKIWSTSGLQIFCDEARAHRSTLKRVITSKSHLIECMVLSYVLLEDIEESNFLNMVTRIAQLSIGKDGFECLENVWTSVFCYSYIRKLINQSSDIPQSTSFPETTGSNWSWKIPKLIISTLEPVFVNDIRYYSKSTSKYLALSIFRCAYLASYWGWQPDRLFVVSLFDFFARRGFTNIEDDSSAFELPQLLLDSSVLSSYSEYDNSFTAFLKLTAITLETLKNQGKQLEITKLNARITPLNGRHYSKMSALKVSDLEALCNQYAVLLVRVAYCPKTARPSADQLRDMNELNDSHILVKKLALSVWKTFVLLILRADDNPEKAMVWFDSMIMSALSEYDSIERNEAKGSDNYHDRINENSRKYVQFFEEGLTAWIDVVGISVEHSWSTSNKFWHKLLRKTSTRILQYGISQNVSKLCLDLLNKFLDRAESNEGTIECFHDVILPGFYKFVSNVISGDTILLEHLSLYSIETWTRLAKLLAENGVISWDSFLLSNYSWNWFSDTNLRSALQPVWYGGMYTVLRDSREPGIFRAQFLRSLTVRDIQYEHKMVEPYMRLNDEEAILSLKSYCDLVRSAKGLRKHRKDILKSYILYMSDIQVSRREFVKDSLGVLLRFVKDTDLKALVQDHSNYFSLAEYVVGMIISNIEIPDIPNLSWFRSSTVFKNAISIFSDSATIKRYTKSELDPNTEKRFCMFMIYSLELSVINNHGDAFVKSTTSALFETDTALSAKSYLFESLFPEYAYLASRDEFAEALLPTVLRLFWQYANEISCHRKAIDIGFCKKMLKFVNAYLQESPDGIYSTAHPYWSTATLTFDLCSTWIASWHDMGKNVNFEDCDPSLLSELVFRALDVILKERMEENDFDLQTETDKRHIREAIMGFLDNYKKVQGKEDWLFKHKHTEDVVTFGSWTSYREAQNSAVKFLMRLFSCRDLPRLVKDDGKGVYEVLIMESKGGMPASICEALVSNVPNIAGHSVDSSKIDDFVI